MDTEGQHAFIQFKINHLGYSYILGNFEEFEGRLAELRRHADRLEKKLPAESQEVVEIAATMKAQMAQLAAVLADVKTAHQTIRERSTGN